MPLSALSLAGMAPALSGRNPLAELVLVFCSYEPEVSAAELIGFLDAVRVERVVVPADWLPWLAEQAWEDEQALGEDDPDNHTSAEEIQAEWVRAIEGRVAMFVQVPDVRARTPRW